jgi:hypothetical protein
VAGVLVGDAADPVLPQVYRCGGRGKEDPSGRKKLVSWVHDGDLEDARRVGRLRRGGGGTQGVNGRWRDGPGLFGGARGAMTGADELREVLKPCIR